MAQDSRCATRWSTARATSAIDGDSAAAMRYTEIRLAKIGQRAADIDIEGLDVPTTTARRSRWSLPSRIPNLLISGSGIAVGDGDQHPAAQPPGEVGRRLPRAAAQQADVSHRRLDRIVPAPDFPTRRPHLRPRRRREGYTHRPREHHHPRAHPFSRTSGKATQADRRRQIPYQVNKKSHARSASPSWSERKALEGISDIRDESDKSGNARVIELRAARSRRRPEQPVQADAAAGHLRHEHGGAGRWQAAPAEPAPDASTASSRTAATSSPPHHLRAAQGRERGHSSKVGGAVQRRRDHRAHQGRAPPPEAKAPMGRVALAAGRGDARIAPGRRRRPDGAKARSSGLQAQGLPAVRRAGAGHPRTCACSASPASSRTRSSASTAT